MNTPFSGWGTPGWLVGWLVVHKADTIKEKVHHITLMTLLVYCLLIVFALPVRMIRHWLVAHLELNKKRFYCKSLLSHFIPKGKSKRK